MEIDFRTFIVQLGQGALVALGDQADPETNQRAVNLLLAQHHIGVLEMLKLKTQGNLSDDEKQLLEALIVDLNEKLEKVSSGS
jgi:hypothetical protein